MSLNALHTLGGLAQQLRQDLLPSPVAAHLAVSQNDDAVGDVQDPLLMGDDEDRAVDLLVQVLEHLDQVGEGPQIDTRLRLVKDGQLGPRAMIMAISIRLSSPPDREPSTSRSI